MSGRLEATGLRLEAATLREYPLPFTEAMIRAIKARAKSQTRRLYGLEHVNVNPDCWGKPRPLGARRWEFQWMREGQSYYHATCPYGDVGDRLWVRETYYIDHVDYERGALPARRPDDVELYYRADGECCQQIPECQCADVGQPRWRPWIHMPRWASRWLLELTDVRCERLQQISLADAEAEGVQIAADETDVRIAVELCAGQVPTLSVAKFRALWQRLHAKPGQRWEDSPWVWALSFTIVEGPTQ